jgi:hypothetical protein
VVEQVKVEMASASANGAHIGAHKLTGAHRVRRRNGWEQRQKPEVLVKVLIHYDADGEKHWETWPQDTIKLVAEERRKGAGLQRRQGESSTEGTRGNGAKQKAKIRVMMKTWSQAAQTAAGTVGKEDGWTDNGQQTVKSGSTMESAMESTTSAATRPRQGDGNSVLGGDGSTGLDCDCVLVTVPLGVLQAEEGTAGAIEFKPPLPPWKQQAIRRLGYGHISKVTLCFMQDQVCYDEELASFGRLSFGAPRGGARRDGAGGADTEEEFGNNPDGESDEAKDTRGAGGSCLREGREFDDCDEAGDCFLWWVVRKSTADTPGVIVAVSSGHAAETMELSASGCLASVPPAAATCRSSSEQHHHHQPIHFDYSRFGGDDIDSSGLDSTAEQALIEHACTALGRLWRWDRRNTKKRGGGAAESAAAGNENNNFFVPLPCHAAVKRWGRDPFSRGAYSYVAVDGSGGDYDLMAASVGSVHESGSTETSALDGAGVGTDRVGGAVTSDLDGTRDANYFGCDCERCLGLLVSDQKGDVGMGRGGRGRGRIFFAGEATNRKHPVAAAGAYMSGVQAACAIDEALVPNEILLI